MTRIFLNQEEKGRFGGTDTFLNNQNVGEIYPTAGLRYGLRSYRPRAPARPSIPVNRVPPALDSIMLSHWLSSTGGSKPDVDTNQSQTTVQAILII